MRKVSLIVAIAMVISVFASIGAFAHVDGQREQYEWTVPHINSENPAINFDGVVDLEGEWKGALCVTIDFSEDSDTYEEVTLWPQGVWSGDFNFNTYDECDPMWNMTINTYVLWDEAGLYLASKCDDMKVTNGSYYNAQEYIDYQMGRIDAYSGALACHFEPMIVCSDSDVAYVNDLGGHWPNFFMGTIPAGAPCWLGDDVATDPYDPNPSDITKAIKHGQVLNTTADANGFYSFSQEIFLPWDYVNSDVNADGEIEKVGNVGTAGTTFTMGLIYSVRSADELQTRMKLTNASGWRNYDFYALSATPAEKSDKVVEDAPVVEEPEVEVEEPVVEEPEVEVEEPVVEETPAPSNPSTADVSVLFYALAAISAIGGISVFKRK